MNETLREKEELSRVDAENIRKMKEDLTVLKRKVDQHAELMQEKDRTVQVRQLLLNFQTNYSRFPLSFPRFCMMKSALFNWNSDKLKNAIRASRRTMPSFYNAGLTQNRWRLTR